MATIKDKIGLAMIPSVYDGGISTSTTDYSGTVHSLLPIQHESPNLVVPDFVTGWTLSNGSVSNSIYSASLTAYQSGIKVTPPWIENYTIKVNFDLIVNSGSIRVDDGVSGVVNTFSTSGSKEITFYGFNKLEFNAYNLGFDGKISNIKVVRISNGDFDFERSSAATRVGSDGYIKDVQVIGEELVQNGDFEDVSETELITNGGFDTDSNWNGINANGVSISNGSLNYSNTTLNHNVSQGSVVVIGRPYKLTFTISNYEKGSILPILGAGGSLQEVSGDGTFTMYGTASINTVFYFQARGTNGTTLSIDNVSVKEVGQNWTFQDEWNIVSNNGDLKAEASSAASGRQLYQNILTNGKKYRASFSVSNLTSGGFSAMFGDGTNTSETINSDGNYSFDFTASSTRGGVRTEGVTTGEVDNFTIKEIIDDTDIPRLDYSDGCPTLLLEPQRTNLVTPSNDFQSWWTVEDLTITPNSTTSPDGTVNASKFASTSTSNAFVREQVAVTSGGDATFSFFAKYDTSQYVFVRCQFFSGGDEARVWFDIKNGVKGSSTVDPVEYSMIPYSNGWYRCVVTWNIDASDLQGYCYIQLSDTDGSFATTIGKSAYIFGGQAEQGSYPTSYIPTNGSAVTRLADVCNNAGDSTIFNDDEGVLYMEIKTPSPAEGNNYVFATITDGSVNNFISLGYDNDTNVLWAKARLNGSYTIDNPTQTANRFVYNKIALKYKSGDSKLYLNGVEVDSDTGTYSGGSLTKLGFEWFDGGFDFYGNIRSLLYFNEALTDAELEKLTSSTATQVLNNYSTLLSRVGATYESSGLETKLNELL